MSKAEERGKIYALNKASEKLHDYYGNAMLGVVQFDGYDIKNAYTDGYQQAEKDNELTWEDIKLLDKIFMNEKTMSGLILGKKEYKEVLKRFKDFKERKDGGKG